MIPKTHHQLYQGKAERLLLIFIAVIITVSMAFATPILTKCGNAILDAKASDAGFLLTFGNTTGNFCEVDFAPIVPSGYTRCYSSYDSIYFQVTQNQDAIDFYPIPPNTSLANGFTYIVCKQNLEEMRQ